MLTYENLPQKVKDYFRRNITMSVAFVKKGDGTVRHMAFRRNLKSYVRKTGGDTGVERSDAQTFVIPNNNLFQVYDTNLYIKALKETGDPSYAAGKSYRRFFLHNALGFLCGGHFFDMRNENQIAERFGEEIASQLTKSMITAMQKQEEESGTLDEIMSENYKAIKFIREQAKKIFNKVLLNENSNIYFNKYHIKTIDNPIIPDAIEIMSNNPDVIKFTHKGNFDEFLNKQRYFSASQSHCFYNIEDYESFHRGEDQWRRDNTGISEADKGCLMLFETGHELAAIWDSRNSVGYILPKDKMLK